MRNKNFYKLAPVTECMVSFSVPSTERAVQIPQAYNNPSKHGSTSNNNFTRIVLNTGQNGQNKLVFPSIRVYRNINYINTHKHKLFDFSTETTRRGIKHCFVVRSKNESTTNKSLLFLPLTRKATQQNGIYAVHNSFTRRKTLHHVVKQNWCNFRSHGFVWLIRILFYIIYEAGAFIMYTDED